MIFQIDNFKNIKDANFFYRIRLSSHSKKRKLQNTNEAFRFIHSFALQSVSLLPDGSYGISISAVQTTIVNGVRASISFDATK